MEGGLGRLGQCGKACLFRSGVVEWIKECFWAPNSVWCVFGSRYLMFLGMHCRRWLFREEVEFEENRRRELIA